MAQRSYMFILFASFYVVINCAIPAKDNANLAVEYRPEVVAVLDHLNSAPIKVYNFKNAIIVESALQKADITELTLDVNVECLNKYPDLPCTDDTLTCNAFVQRPSLPGLESTVLGDVKCKPKIIASVDSAANPADATVAEEPEVPPPSSRSPKESISLSNEAVSQESGENFVAVRRDSAVPCLGCAVDINTDALGVDELVNLGLQHVEQENVKKHAVVKVLRIQQQVVSGVKYILLFEIAPTICDKNAPYNLDACPLDTKAKISTCEIVYLQKPWINKAKHIIANNCTRSQEYVAPESSSSSSHSDIKYANNEIDNEIEVSGGGGTNNHRIKSFLPGDKRPYREELNFDRIAESGTIDEEMSPSRLADLESQILFVESDLPAAPVPKRIPYQQEVPQTDDNPEMVRFSLDVMPNTNEFPSLYTEQPEEPSMIPVAVSSSSTYLEANLATEDRPSNSQNTEESLNLNDDTLPSSSSTTNFDINEDNFELNSTSASVPSDDEVLLTSTESTSSTTVDPELAEVQSDQAQVVSENNARSSEENSSSEEDNPTKSPKNVKIEESTSSNTVRKQSSSEENSSEENSSEEKKSESKQNSRTKRAVPHMEKISHEEKNLVKDLADYAAVALDNMDDDNNRRVVLQILGAKKMVAEDGIYYRLILRLGISQCSENKPPKPNENCKEKLLENYTKICKVQIHVNDEVSNPKVVKSQCQNIKRDNKNDSNRTNYSRHRREVLVGGQQSYDKNDPKIGQFVQESLSRLDSESSHKTRYKPIEIVDATSQVVSGALYRIKVKTGLSDCPKDDQNKKLEECGLLNNADEPPRDCLIKVWDRPWLKRREITINCEGQSEHKFEVTEAGGRSQRQTRLLGGQIQESVDSPNVFAYLQHGLRHLDSQSRHQNKLKLLQVLSATKQIVSGQLWRIKARVAVSDCNKNDLTEPENCGILQGGQSQVCDFRVWDQPWLPNGLQIDVNCDDDDKQYSFRSKRSNPETQSFKKRSDLKPRGGINPVSVNDTEVLEHLTRGLQHLDSQSSHQNKYRVHEVVSASHQTVSGSLWRIEAKVVLSDCSKNDNKDLKECKTLEGSVPKTCNFKVWDQPWLPNGREINITCENEEREYSFRSKRSVPGGVSEADLNDPIISQYLTTSLQHLDSESSHQNKYKVHKVLLATKQVVSGSLWKIKAQIVLSECSKNDNSKKELSECRPLLGASPKTCNFEIWDQPWLPQGRETKINCEDEPKQHLFRSRRDATTHRSQRSVLGGISPADKNDPEISQFLTTGLQHLDSQSSHQNKYRVHEVVSATHQTVSGSLWRIEAKVVLSDCSKNDNKDLKQCKTLEGSVPKTCNFKVWDQPWLPNGREINITCENEEKEYSFRSKRSIPGGVSEADLNDPIISQYLTTSLQHLDSESSHQNKYKVHKVLSANKQVVSGSLWKIKAQIVLSECSKNDNSKKELSECRPLLGASPKTCNFEIWDQPWLPQGRETKINCEDEPKQHLFRSRRDVTTHRSQRSVPGGISPADKNDPEISQFLTTGLQHLDSQSSHQNKYRVHEVVSATHQTVSGSLWRIEAKVVLSDCSKNDNKDLKQCKTLEGSVPKTCNFKVWDQPWLPNGREINITCENEERQYSFRSKRSVPGDVIQADLNDPIISQYLTTGLQHLDSQSSHQNKYKVHKVLSATQQVVSGSLWKIRAQIVLSECSKNDNSKKQLSECRSLLGASLKTCDFEIWDQPWLPQGRQTKINCEDEQRQYSFRSRPAAKYLHHTTHFIGKDDRNLQFSMFRKFIAKHQKNYTSKQEFKRRFHIFRQNLKYIGMLNRYEQGTAKYGITQFADQSRKEFSRSLGLRPDLRQDSESFGEFPFTVAPTPAVDLPVEFDWRDKGAVTPVKNQGQCGSCWAFSVTGNVEGQYKLKHGDLLEFSEQELVDCDKVDEGCNGGLMDNAYRAIENLGGLETESDYPYDAEDEKCHFNRSLARVQLTGALNISHNETDMAKWLVNNGPISIAINANAMQFYMGGVSHPLKFLCSPKSLDHGVLVVGYGVHKYPLFNKTLPYWIVKNSWGRSWGEQGYYRVYRGDGTCGLNQTPSSAIVA